MADESTDVRRCDYCRLPIPKDRFTATVGGDRYEFCSRSCRDAQADSEHVFTEYHGHRRFEPNVSALDASLPQGIPRNSFVLLTDLAGTRTEAVQAEIVWRALQRGEPVVYVSFLEPPVSVIQEFATLEWNVVPYLEDGQFRIVDCFTHRVDDRDRMFHRMNAWNKHLSTVAEEATTWVRDPSDVGELESRLDNALEENDMADEGIVVVDSLTELGALIQPIQAYNVVKDVRADVCKGRFVPIFAGATVTGRAGDEAFPHDLKYMVDGVVEMQLDEEIVEDALVKRIRVRKMSGVLVYPEWHAYEYAPGEGIVTFDPIEEMGERDDREGETPPPVGTTDGGEGPDGPADEESNGG